MKNFVLFLFSLLIVNCTNNQSEKSNIEKDFVGKTVQEFLDSRQERYVEYQFVQEPPGKLIGCQFVYSPEMRIVLYAYELKHVKKFNIYGNWDFEKFKKETISAIEVVKP